MRIVRAPRGAVAIVYASISFLVLAVSCSSLGTRAGDLPLYGMVYDMDNQPVQNARVSGMGGQTAVTDANGRFALADLAFGSVRLEFLKEGYESQEIAVEYVSRAQVLYVKMISAGQLRTLAEAAIRERRWEDADLLTGRAERICPGHPETLFLMAIVRFRRGDSEGARTILEELLDREYREPVIHLFLADILQYRLSDPGSAASHLRSFLSLRHDPETERRLAAVEKTEKAEEPLRPKD